MQAMQHNLYQLKGALRTETTNGIPLCRRKLLMSHNGVENCLQKKQRKRANIPCGLYIINPLFEGQKCFQGVFIPENYSFIYHCNQISGNVRSLVSCILLLSI